MKEAEIFSAELLAEAQPVLGFQFLGALLRGLQCLLEALKDLFSAHSGF